MIEIKYSHYMPNWRVGAQVLYKQNDSYYKCQSYVCRPPCIKGHFYVQGINPYVTQIFIL